MDGSPPFFGLKKKTRDQKRQIKNQIQKISRMDKQDKHGANASHDRQGCGLCLSFLFFN